MNLKSCVTITISSIVSDLKFTKLHGKLVFIIPPVYKAAINLKCTDERMHILTWTFHNLINSQNIWKISLYSSSSTSHWMLHHTTVCQWLTNIGIVKAFSPLSKCMVIVVVHICIYTYIDSFMADKFKVLYIYKFFKLNNFQGFCGHLFIHKNLSSTKLYWQKLGLHPLEILVHVNSYIY